MPVLFSLLEVLFLLVVYVAIIASAIVLLPVFGALMIVVAFGGSKKFEPVPMENDAA